MPIRYVNNNNFVENTFVCGASGSTRIFWGGIEGAKCFLRGQKSKNLPKMADFDNFFLLTGRQGGGQR